MCTGKAKAEMREWVGRRVEWHGVGCLGGAGNAIAMANMRRRSGPLKAPVMRQVGGMDMRHRSWVGAGVRVMTEMRGTSIVKTISFALGRSQWLHERNRCSVF